MTKKPKPLRNENGEILRPTKMYYDTIKKKWIYELHTREERRKIVKLQRKVVSEDSKTKRRRKHEIVSDMDLHPSAESK